MTTFPHGDGPTEQNSLLPNSHMIRRRTHFRLWASVCPILKDAHPFWLIPVVLVMSMSRGLTMAPRIQVYKAIACRMLSETSRQNNLETFMECGDAAVQARAAKIQAAVVTTMSILSAISTGFWSRLGDSYGRKLVLSIFLIGALLMEAVFILVMRPNSFFGRYAEHFILAGPIVEGLLGGLSTFNGAVHAYISDCTRHGSRSTIFSTVQGMVFVGLAIGPWIGGILFPAKGYNDGFFVGSISLIFLTLLYVAFVCPESRVFSNIIAAEQSDRETSFVTTSPVIAIRRLTTKLLSALLLPISIFAPRRVPGTSGRNWNMTLCGLSLFFYVVSTGVYSAKYLYAQHVYEWTTAQLGYYMSTLWVTRALNLLLFLPILLPYLKPKPKSTGIQSAQAIAAEMNFDRYLAGISLAVDGFADGLVATVSSKSSSVFVALSCLSSFTSGGNPALHSLGAVCLHACGRDSEVGALFGAMGALSAIGHIVSPYIYALTYASSVAQFPEAIFVLAACLLFTVVLLLAQISSTEDRIVDHDPPDERSGRNHDQYTYQALSTDGDDNGVP